MLQLKPTRVLLTLVAFVLIPAGACLADTINLGFIQFIGGTSGGTAGFNILNDTGPNSSPFPDTSFPVTTPVSFSDLTLKVNFTDGTNQTFLPASGYFTLASDHLSYSGGQESTFATDPITSAMLTGTFNTTNLSLNDGSLVTIPSSFTAAITDPFGALALGDFSLITAFATPATTATPEPSLALLLACGLIGLALFRYTHAKRA
jgi:hypothetical protein